MKNKMMILLIAMPVRCTHPTMNVVEASEIVARKLGGGIGLIVASRLVKRVPANPYCIVCSPITRCHGGHTPRRA